MANLSSKTYTFDIGNSNPSFGIHIDGTLKSIYPISKWETPPTKFCAVKSQVGKPLPEKIVTEIKDNLVELPKLHNGKFLDMPVNYQDSLGVDRLYSAYYIFKTMLQAYHSILLIDAGTFTTIDLVNNSGFKGGLIFPGINQYLKAYCAGYNLPQIELPKFNLEQIKTLPTTTTSAITSSFMLQAAAVLDHLIHNVHPDLIIVTGGKHEVYRNILEKIHPTSKVSVLPSLIHNALFFLATNSSQIS